MSLENITWEIGKLGSNRNVLHKGTGSLVFKASMEWALEHGAKRLFILSNSKLKPALHIYEKNGFKEINLMIMSIYRKNNSIWFGGISIMEIRRKTKMIYEAVYEVTDL